MPTFADLQKNLVEARGRRTVLMYLANLLESDFLPPSADSQPKRLLIMDDKVPVPKDVIDTVVEDLLKEADALATQAESIMNMTVPNTKSKEKSA